MIGTTINFTAIDGRTGNIRVMFDDFAKINEVIEDYFALKADYVRDESIELILRDFGIFIKDKPIGYRYEINSVEPSARVVDVDVASGTITSAIGSETPEVPDITMPKIEDDFESKILASIKTNGNGKASGEHPYISPEEAPMPSYAPANGKDPKQVPSPVPVSPAKMRSSGGVPVIPGINTHDLNSIFSPFPSTTINVSEDEAGSSEFGSDTNEVPGFNMEEEPEQPVEV